MAGGEQGIAAVEVFLDQRISSAITDLIAGAMEAAEVVALIRIGNEVHVGVLADVVRQAVEGGGDDFECCVAADLGDVRKGGDLDRIARTDIETVTRHDRRAFRVDHRVGGGSVVLQKRKPDGGRAAGQEEGLHGPGAGGGGGDDGRDVGKRSTEPRCGDGQSRLIPCGDRPRDDDLPKRFDGFFLPRIGDWRLPVGGIDVARQLTKGKGRRGRGSSGGVEVIEHVLHAIHGSRGKVRIGGADGEVGGCVELQSIIGAVSNAIREGEAIGGGG